MATTTNVETLVINYLTEAQYQEAVQSGLIDENALYLTPDDGSGGSMNYNDLTNKPSIEGVTLQGNKMFPDLNLDVLTNTEIQDIFDNLI